MPPRPRISKEDVLSAAIDVVRRCGADAVNARAVATAIGCSTQPVFSNYPSMENLKNAVAQRAADMYRERLVRETEEGRWPPYKAMGMGYIRFATEEPSLFKMLFLSPTRAQALDVRDWESGVVQAKLNGVPDEEAAKFHTEMWVFVHGIAAMIATGAMAFETEDISRMISDVYDGLCRRHVLSPKEEQP